MTSSSCRTEGSRSSNAGFTLLEVLLTSLLAAIVLVSLWSLSDIYLRLFVSGKKKIEEVQLVRGLTHQLSQDVSLAIQIGPSERLETLASPASLGPAERPTSSANGIANSPRGPAANTPNEIPPASTGGTGASGSAGTNRVLIPPAAASALPQTTERRSDLATPQFGLFGTKHSLRLIVLVADPLAFRDPVDLSDVLPEPGQPRAPLASELRTIEYSFDAHHDTGSSGQQRPPGLIRREWPWESWSGLRLASQQLSGGASGRSMMPPEVAEWTAEDALALENNQNILHLPQISALEFRFFDGVDWETEWNSSERRQLPRLVEVLFMVKASATEEPSPRRVEVVEDVDEPDSLSDQTSSSSSSVQSTRRGMIYRQLIHLPAWETDRPTELPGQSPPVANSPSPPGLVGARRP